MKVNPLTLIPGPPQLATDSCERLRHLSEEPWPRKDRLLVGPNNDQDDCTQERVDAYRSRFLWTWSGRRLFYFCDIHADPDAFRASLLACGAITHATNLTLSDIGRHSRFVIGGDCFDKGPDNLGLLDVISNLRQQGADLVILAGNHDVRTWLGMRYATSKDILLDHLFVRMGRKTAPLLKEIYDRYVARQPEALQYVSADIENALMPDDAWYSSFADAARDRIPNDQLIKEIRRIREKVNEFNASINELGLSLAQAYQSVMKFHDLFISPSGRYAWLFQEMKLAHIEGSYLYIHAGVDDTIARFLREEGVDRLNRQFSAALTENPFAMYHGVLGNCFRTKYRDYDFEFSERGSQCMHRAGLFAIVHGHRNICHGQRLTLRHDMLNFECDASVDMNTRRLEGLEGPGAAVVTFEPDGSVCARSTDHPRLRRFRPGSIMIANP
ncbi:MAG: hypothetical protein AAF525_04725 [Pseudomonadota bacterium]